MKRRSAKSTVNAELPHLAEVQLEIMNVFWSRGELSVGDVWNAVSANRKVARNTVLTHVARLEAKGWLQKCPGEGVQKFKASRPRRQTHGQLARRFLATVFGGSPTQLMMSLLSERQVSPDEIQQLRQLLEQHEGDQS